MFLIFGVRGNVVFDVLVFQGSQEARSPREVEKWVPNVLLWGISVSEAARVPIQHNKRRQLQDSIKRIPMHPLNGKHSKNQTQF